MQEAFCPFSCEGNDPIAVVFHRVAVQSWDLPLARLLVINFEVLSGNIFQLFPKFLDVSEDFGVVSMEVLEYGWEMVFEVVVDGTH